MFSVATTQSRKTRKLFGTLINFGSKANAITPTYTPKLGLEVWQTDVKAQRIDGSLLKNYEIFAASFQVIDRLGRTHSFQEIFLLAETTMEMVLGMRFLTFSIVNIYCKEKTYLEILYYSHDSAYYPMLRAYW